MSRSKWIAAAALMALAVPAAQGGDRTRVQITIAPSWGWGVPVHRPPPRAHDYGPRYYPGPRHHGGPRQGGYYGAPVIRFDYVERDRHRYYGQGGYRPGGYLRYDSRRDRDYRHGHRYDRRDGDRRHRDRRDRDRDWRD